MDDNDNFGRDSQSDASEEPARTAAMAELLEHLLEQYWGMGYRMGQGYGQAERPQLLPGRMPAQLPIDLPVPEGCRVVGSVLWTQAISLVFECNMARDEAFQFYEERLLSRGWTKPDIPDPFGGGGGFTRNWPEDYVGRQYCYGERGPSMSVRVIDRVLGHVDDRSEGPRSLQISINTDPEQSPCSPRLRRQYRNTRMSMGPGMPSVLPELKPPAGGSQFGHGGSGGGADNVHSEAWLKSDLDMAAILAHYGEQLAAAGWKEVSRDRSGPVGCSSWDFTFKSEQWDESEEWHGMLTITERPWSKGEYRLRLYAEIEGFGKHGGVVFMGQF